MSPLYLAIFGGLFLVILTVINPFCVLPFFIFGSFLEPMQNFPELRQYNPTTLLGLAIVIAWFIHILLYQDFEKARSKQMMIWWFFILWTVISSWVNRDTSWGIFFVYLRTFIPYFFYFTGYSCFVISFLVDGFS